MHSYRTREPGGPADPASDTSTDRYAETVQELRAALETAVAGRIELARIAEAACPGSRIGLIDARDLRIGDVLVASPLVQVTAIRRSQYGTTMGTTITTAYGDQVLIRDHRVLGFRPGQPDQRCRHCGRTWTQGCHIDCNVRYHQLDHAEITRVLHLMGLERIDDSIAEVHTELAAAITLLNRPYTGQKPNGIGTAR